jgi:hypothetical protein
MAFERSVIEQDISNIGASSASELSGAAATSHSALAQSSRANRLG